MKRRVFPKSMIALGVGAHAASVKTDSANAAEVSGNVYVEPSKKIPVRHFDVVVAGGGTAGVFAALAAARQGARTMLIESKGYCGGIAVEGGTAIHSFYNLYKEFGVKKRQVVQGIPSEFIDRLTKIGGATGYPEMETGTSWDSVCTAIDTETYKMLAMKMLEDAGVFLAVNTLLVDAIMSGSKIEGVITESRSGREAIMAKSFIDSTGYGDLSAYTGAEFTVPNDYSSANGFGIANASIDDYHAFLKSHDAVGQVCRGTRSGEENKFIRMGAEQIGETKLGQEARKIGMSLVTTTVHDNYLMFIKFNYKVPGSVLNRDDVAKAEVEIRKRMHKGAELFRKHVPNFDKAFIARTSPSLAIRRGRSIVCDYDISNKEILNGDHFDDDVFVYGFHDSAPRFQVKDGGTYGIPYRALCVKGIDNLYAAGMLITSEHDAHMSTRNTVSCMGQGQATGTAAALCADKGCGTRSLKYSDLRTSLDRGGVYFES
jgi:hypothetical protein